MNKKFFYCHNNGVTALVSEEVYRDMDRERAIRRFFESRDESVSFEERWRATIASRAIRHLTAPTFTFAREERASESPWFTETNSFMESLVTELRHQGAEVERGEFFVPFSNAAETGIHGQAAMESELHYVTTECQFRETFGFGSTMIREKYSSVAA